MGNLFLTVEMFYCCQIKIMVEISRCFNGSPLFPTDILFTNFTKTWRGLQEKLAEETLLKNAEETRRRNAEEKLFLEAQRVRDLEESLKEASAKSTSNEVEMYVRLILYF